jgi:hypothetical protein
MIPGMGPEDKVEMPNNTSFGPSTDLDPSVIPGLDFDSLNDLQKPTKKVPYAKPIPKNFQAQWNETKSEFWLISFKETCLYWICFSRRRRGRQAQTGLD